MQESVIHVLMAHRLIFEHICSILYHQLWSVVFYPQAMKDNHRSKLKFAAKLIWMI